MEFDDAILLKEQAAPGTPAAGFEQLFMGTDHRAHVKDPNGVDTALVGMLFAKNSADQSVTNSTTLVDATGLSLSLDNGVTYIILGMLHLEAGTTGDIKIANAFSGTSPRNLIGLTAVNVKGGTPGQAIDLTPTGRSFDGVGNNFPCFMYGMIVTSSTGILKIQFAQDVSDATASKIRNGSWMGAIPVQQ